MPATEWIRKQFLGLAIGAAVTAVTVIAYLAGWLTPLDRALLDFDFGHANRVVADPRIVVIDINDPALQRIGRWPWPRRLHADLVDTLHECGAETILLDLVYAEPSAPRVEHPSLDVDNDIDPAGEVFGQFSESDVVRDDAEFAQAIRRDGRVYVPMFFPLAPPGVNPEDFRDAARALVAEDRSIDVTGFARALGIPANHEAAGILLGARIEDALEDNFGLKTEAIADRLGADLEDVEQRISRAKQHVARRRVSEVLAKCPEESFADVYKLILPGASLDAESPDRHELRDAYRYAVSMRIAREHMAPSRVELDGVIPNGYDATMPIPALASAAGRIGFVNFEKDVDGILRRVPLLADFGDRIVAQIAFRLAVDVLDIDLAAIQVDGRTLLLSDRNKDREWRVPLDARGEMLLNWHVDHARPEWQGSFQHVPVARVMEVPLNRRTVRQNEARIRLNMGQAVELMFEGAESAYLDYEAKVRQAKELRERLTELPTDDPERDRIAAQIDALDGDLDAVEEQALGNLRRLADEIKGLEPQDDYERELFARVAELEDNLLTHPIADELTRLNETLRHRNEALLAELRERIGGKYCFVGHTAAAQADMVNTPVFESMPGVLAHANLLNTFLTGAIPTVGSRAVNVLLIVLAGALTTVLTSSRGPWLTFAAILGLIVAVLAASMLAMFAWGHFVATLVPAGCIFVTWSMITLYRQLAEERKRRSVTSRLARSTSPAIARHITERLGELELPPRPAQVTCYFSDLAGFTTIAERLDGDQTKTLLNRYLGAMGEVLIKHRAFNKFMGDGIFAFFNAPIWPVEEHPVVGCEAALATAERLEALKSSAASEYAAEMAGLNMRIGLHTGSVFVGDFGSANQSDYTCIGDTVNLAARLEPANKVFGTRILVSGPCREATGDKFHFRPLGDLQVKGKAQAIPVYELLGRCGEVADEQREYADLFGRAIKHFQARAWDEARLQLEECQTRRPDDTAIAVYLQEIGRHKRSAPASDWNRAIELTSK